MTNFFTKKLDIRVFVGIMAFVGGRGHWHNTRGKDMTQTNQTNLTANAVAVESNLPLSAIMAGMTKAGMMAGSGNQLSPLR